MCHFFRPLYWPMKAISVMQVDSRGNYQRESVSLNFVSRICRFQHRALGEYHAQSMTYVTQKGCLKVKYALTCTQ